MPATETYYDTTNASPDDVRAYRKQAKKQQATVLKFFEEHPGMYFTPFDIQFHVLPGAPITSIRRAMTNLTKEKYGCRLVKMDRKKKGIYARDNHTWILNTGQLELFN